MRHLHFLILMIALAPLVKNSPARADETCPIEFKKLALCASIDWTVRPSTQDEGAFTIRFWSKSGGQPTGPYIDPSAKFSARLFMPDMGHGSSPTKITPHGAGVFDVSSLYFIMPGHWEMHLELKRNQKLIDEAVLGYDL